MREVVVGRRDASRHSNISDNTVPNIPGEETRRVHNDVNELTGIDLTANGTPDLNLMYEGAGNLRIEDRNASTTHRYTHDLWNRLVKIEIDDNSTWEPVAEYESFGCDIGRFRVQEEASRCNPFPGTFPSRERRPG